ncbi:RNA polymerase II mediator complex subunit [Elasticomyces elasticus]|uniref:Mediator of RNA polymerase II transcription subunit 17 n=1 Tax=Exophiala sideris TaxID=1016849 RepID=A0ABR0J4Q8_9EURO|nr:RNA polymerase II mediator complex subunit [Elasticomyces elasticus]KAK5027312.1 RNA polymerase II mediator complex subunit [Exophiala sideris]KAK5034986.1 RNA polymerase II mediator complex subunit [Exophiala sideris]KAK5056280.1 RNA polymerase II mediator complex subunit [Exophiala sideris]KAK5181231.1 RNA polymerase II mediator complex subunit [Eurotiomycetes sp. CCFEE 6388]
MAESNAITVVVPPEPSSRSEDLQSQILRVIAQKGHFRNVTEEGLRAEIHGKAPTVVKGAIPENEAQGGEDDTPQKRQERLWKRREEMIERLSYAQNEILCALDFVSLLISKQWVPAQGSMSPALKEAVPVGTLSGRTLKNKTLPASSRRLLTSLSRGWRSEGFRSASEKLAATSSRLRNDAERESEYWAQIANLTTNGWAVSRLPRDRKAIGVHFGFAESAPQFRDRGFALLRQSDDGSVFLDRPSNPRRRTALGVSVIRDNAKTGYFHFRTAKGGQAGDINQQLRDMRDSLFEEELFYEVCREARVAANQGIHIRAEAVEIEVGGDYQLSLAYGPEQEDDIPTNAEDKLIAEFVAVSLRLLLSAAHEANLSRRSQKPPPMTLKPRPGPEYALIRPVLAHLRHKAEATAFWNSCQALLRPFKQAGIPITIEIDNSSATVFDSLSLEASKTVLSHVMLPAKTGFKVHLTEGRIFEVGLATFLGPPLFGSRYESNPIDLGYCKIPTLRQETRDAATSSLRHILTLALVAHIQEALMTQGIPGMPESEVRYKGWTVTQPHNGELSLYDTGQVLRTLQVAVQTGSIVLKINNLVGGTAMEWDVWTWTSQGATKASEVEVESERRSFDQVVLSLLSVLLFAGRV